MTIIRQSCEKFSAGIGNRKSFVARLLRLNADVVVEQDCQIVPLLKFSLFSFFLYRGSTYDASHI